MYRHVTICYHEICLVVSCTGHVFKAGGAVHMVKEVTVGHRSILKMAFENCDDKPIMPPKMPIHHH